MSPETSICTTCGQPLGADGHCPHCAAAAHVWTLRDWKPLATLAVIIALGFSFVRLVDGAWEAKRQHLVDLHYTAGQRDLEQHRAAEAVGEIESALFYAGGQFDYRLALSDALLASGQRGEALAQLETLLQQQPDDARVLMKLARLEARRQRVEAAIYYYQQAIAGVWPASAGGDPFVLRLEARFELAEYQIAQDHRAEASASLASLSEGLQRGGHDQLRLADLYLRNGLPQAALEVYESELRRTPGEREALAGAAQASLEKADYAAAKRYLAEIKPADDQSRALSQSLKTALALDPFAPGVNASERARRTVHAYRIAIARLSRCGVNKHPGRGIDMNKDAERWSSLVKWADQLSPWMSEKKLRGHDEIVESTLRFVFQAEMTAERDCAGGEADDDAMRLLGRQRLGASQ